jgi:hypothetical protein
MLFPKFIVEILIYAALVGSGLGMVTLLLLLFKDFKKRRIW